MIAFHFTRFCHIKSHFSVYDQNISYEILKIIITTLIKNFGTMHYIINEDKFLLL